ncbi:MAG: pyrroloquinoline quinone biosynthesis protein PqqB [Caldilineae bacterium]|nr:MAG: pyrroloquinoline quinone biosynthesis protein PqqB [Caldilineae bacterium]
MPATQPAFEALLLGVAQDGGLPHAGCDCPQCSAAWHDPALRQPVACLGLLDHRARRFWLIDATPDFPAQLQMAKQAGTPPAPPYSLAGIFLTHAHIGHYTGLIHLGREAMNTRHLPLHCTPSMADFLRGNAPWSALIEQSNIRLHRLPPHIPEALTDGIHITAVPVPHRREFSDTVAYLVQGPDRILFYCPDIDRWQGVDLAGAWQEGGVALLDGTFFHPDELPGRDLHTIPHPFVRDTVQFFRQRLSTESPPQVLFIHLNHTNPLWQQGPERAWVRERGFGVGKVGMRWPLA